MDRKLIFALLLSAFMFCSCGAYHRLAYMQDMQVDKVYDVQAAPDAKIQIGDKLRIVVTCGSPELAAPFNVITGSIKYNPVSETVEKNSSGMEEKGYLVDKEGFITFPVLGKLKVEGLTLDEFKLFLEGQLKGRNYIKDPIVYVDFINFEIILIGEGGVGKYNIPSGGINMFQLLAESGDLTGDAIRNDIRVIRSVGNTKRAYSINLQSVDCYNSPVFYLQQNDMVYALPKDNKIDTATDNAMTIATMIMSAVGTLSNILLWAKISGVF